MVGSRSREPTQDNVAIYGRKNLILRLFEPRAVKKIDTDVEDVCRIPEFTLAVSSSKILSVAIKFIVNQWKDYKRR